MNLGFLDKSSRVTPLLVQLYDSQRLKSLTKDEQPLARAELVSAVSQLLDMELSARESELIADVLIGLMRQAEVDLRSALAERLASLDNVPLRLVLQMANDEIAVAGSILRHSPVLGDLDLIYLIKSKGPLHWQAMAQREKMSFQVMNLLVDSGDFETACNLVKNMKITLSEHTLTVLSDMARESDEIAMPLVRREEVSAEMARGLYKFVGEEVKRMIQARYNVTDADVMDAVEDVISELMEAAGESAEFTPSAVMLKAADRYKEKGLLTIPLMLGTLRRGQFAPFVAQFSRYTGQNPATVVEILSQSSGQGLAVSCKAFDLPKEDFVSIFLLTNRMRNRGRMVDLNDMTKAVNYYNRIGAEMARDILRNSVPGISAPEPM